MIFWVACFGKLWEVWFGTTDESEEELGPIGFGWSGQRWLQALKLGTLSTWGVCQPTDCNGHWAEGVCQLSSYISTKARKEVGAQELVTKWIME